MNKFYNELNNYIKSLKSLRRKSAFMCCRNIYFPILFAKGYHLTLKVNISKATKIELSKKIILEVTTFMNYWVWQEKICNDLYHAKYVDSRTLSGMNCMAILIMAIVDKSSTVLITTKECGGHPSLANILDNLGIRYLPIPYDSKSLK